jgi:hypothetical protein
MPAIALLHLVLITSLPSHLGRQFPFPLSPSSIVNSAFVAHITRPSQPHQQLRFPLQNQPKHLNQDDWRQIWWQGLWLKERAIVCVHFTQLDKK